MTTGTPEQLMRIDIQAEMEHWFRDDSRSEDPEFVLIMGSKEVTRVAGAGGGGGTI